MNFLGHYYVDQHRSNPYFVYGALLPDLVRHFARIYNKMDKHYHSENSSHQQIFQGIRRHMQADTAFHDLYNFHNACDQVEVLLSANTQLAIPRPFFIAHILVELLIDKHLVTKDEQIAHNFYHSLKQLDHNELISFADSIHFFEFKSTFLPRFELFIKNEYALKIMHNENVYIALDKICFERVNFSPSNIQKSILMEIIATTDEQLSTQYETILNKTIEKLNNE